MPAILFVCTANICRSPMAEALFKHILKDRKISGDWIVESAGTWGLDGESAAAGSKAVMNSKGIDLSDHRARSIDQDIIQSFDLILTMESGQKESLRMEFSDSSDHIFLLSEMVNQKHDIADPYGGVYAEYEQAADEILEYLSDGFDTIINKAQHSG
jgi:protein-tyrosine-phosphatase